MFSDLTWKKVFVWKNVGGGGLAHALPTPRPHPLPFLNGSGYDQLFLENVIPKL